MAITYVFRIITEIHATDMKAYDLLQMKKQGWVNGHEKRFYVGTSSLGETASRNYIRRIVHSLKSCGENMKNYGRIKYKDGCIHITVKKMTRYSGGECLRIISAEAIPLDHMYYATREEPNRQLAYKDHIIPCMENPSHRVVKKHSVCIFDYYIIEMGRFFLHTHTHAGKRTSEMSSICWEIAH
jgi:hypothetical protein